MTSIVLDASAAVAILGGIASGGEIVRASPVYAPDLIDVEVAHVVRSLVTRGRVSEQAAEAIIESWANNNVIRVPPVRFLTRIWSLRERLNAHDATYVALAENYGVPLLTSDERLAGAASQYCRVITV